MFVVSHENRPPPSVSLMPVIPKETKETPIRSLARQKTGIRESAAYCFFQNFSHQYGGGAQPSLQPLPISGINVSSLLDQPPGHEPKPELTAEFFFRHHVAEFSISRESFSPHPPIPRRWKISTASHRDFYASANGGTHRATGPAQASPVDQQAGYFDKTNYRSGGPSFSLLTNCARELQKRGHTRSYDQIVLALNILSQSTIDIVSVESGEKPFAAPLTCLFWRPVSRSKLRTDPQGQNGMVQFSSTHHRQYRQTSLTRQYNYHPD